MSYDRHQPYYTSIKERYILNQPGSGKKTTHIVLDISFEQLPYRAGDAIGVLPRNSRMLVDKTLKAMGASGDEMVLDSKTDELLPLRQLFLCRRSIRKIKRKVFDLIVGEDLPSELQDRKVLKAYLQERELWDLIEEWGCPDLQLLCDKLSPLLPRLYSIASSPRLNPNELHLTVGSVEYESAGKQRKGVCTEYLCEEQSLGEKTVGVYIQPTKNFLLPQDPAVPVIMVGPGTGVAPFRAFIQERVEVSEKNWLFFGDRHRKTDYLYEQELSEWEQSGRLRLSLAFSRDQQEKRYVQHELWDKREEVWAWLEQGGIFYVCGDAQQMAPDVEQMLLRVFEEVGGKGKEGARAYLKELRRAKRYLRDVY